MIHWFEITDEDLEILREIRPDLIAAAVGIGIAGILALAIVTAIHIF